ncbi:MAG: flagellar type III secretion system pore protein FliP [Longimicrobiales bacterium]
MILNVFAALCFILGLVLVAARVLRLKGRGGSTEDHSTDIRLLSRKTLAPKQGLAVVEIGDQRFAVSFGDGGVRLLERLESAPVEAAEDEGPQPLPYGVTGPIRLSSRLRKTALSLMLAVGSGVVAPSVLQGQVPPPATVPQPATVTTVDVPTVQAPAADATSTGVQAAADGVEPLGPGVLWDLMQAAGVGSGNEEDALLPGPVGAVLFVGFLTLLPTLLLLMTSFTRILVVLNLLRQAVGTQTAPPSHLLIALALLLTGFVMAPTLQEVNTVALRPWVDAEIDEVQMLEAGAGPFRDFMLSQVREQDLAMFAEMQSSRPQRIEDVPLTVVTSAFVTSELRRAFQIGFALFLPFVIIDVVVASVLMSMGMFMLPPVMVSLPFKLLLFVLVDGWALMLGGLVRSFGV